MGAVGGLMKAAGASALANSPIVQTLGALGGGSTPNPFSNLLNPSPMGGSVAPMQVANPSPMDMAAGAMGQRGPLLTQQGSQPGRPVSATAGPAQSAYRQAISGIESGGRYDAIGPTHPKLGRALGKYQIMEANIGPWSREALGRSISADEFMRSPALQDAIFDRKFGQYVAKYGPEKAAQAWLGGEGGIGTNRRDSLGTSVGEYGQRFMASLGGTQPGEVQTPQATQTPTDWGTLTSTLTFDEGADLNTPFGTPDSQPSAMDNIMSSLGKGNFQVAAQTLTAEGEPAAVDTGEEEIAKLVEQQSQMRQQPQQRAAQRRQQIRARVGYQA